MTCPGQPSLGLGKNVPRAARISSYEKWGWRNNYHTLPGRAGTRGMVVGQRDSQGQDTGRAENVTNRRPEVEPPRRAPHTDTAVPGGPGHEAAQPGGTRWSWRLLRGVLHLRTFVALRHREFRLLWAGQVATAMAMWMEQVVRGWLLYELTNSPVQLGLVQGVQALPMLVLSPVAGSVADRYPRQRQIVVAQGLAGVMYAGLALLIMTGRIQPWHVYATAIGMAIVQTFHQPARAAMVAEAVPSCHLTNAIGLTSIGFNVARSTGPALAGFLIATHGTVSCYAVQVGCYVVAIICCGCPGAPGSYPRPGRGGWRVLRAQMIHGGAPYQPCIFVLAPGANRYRIATIGMNSSDSAFGGV